jgi:cyanophycinase
MNKFSIALLSLLLAMAPAFLSGSLYGQSPDGSAAGHLFIIGGGKRPAAMLEELIKVAGLSQGGHVIILTMASSEPDTAAFYGIKQFVDMGLPAERLRAYHFEKGHYPVSAVDSLRFARLIYLSGGDQNKFMDVVLGSPLYEAIHQAYRQGATIAGTSAGAAVMSRKMISGNEHKHPEYTGDFRTIEADNIEIKAGLGLLPGAIVDQHFVYRMRMNRLIAVALEHPAELCIGIDESTAIVVSGRRARVVGDYQAILLRNPLGSHQTKDGLLGGRGLELSVLLPGEEFEL